MLVDSFSGEDVVYDFCPCFGGWLVGIIRGLVDALKGCFVEEWNEGRFVSKRFVSIHT